MKSRQERVSLSPEVRRELRGDIDIEALEKLLGRLPLQLRAIILGAAMASPEGDPLTALASEEAVEVAPDAMPGGPTNDRQVRLPGQLSDLEFDDPELQSLLDEVLAPWRRKM